MNKRMNIAVFSIRNFFWFHRFYMKLAKKWKVDKHEVTLFFKAIPASVRFVKLRNEDCKDYWGD